MLEHAKLAVWADAVTLSLIFSKPDNISTALSERMYVRTCVRARVVVVQNIKMFLYSIFLKHSAVLSIQ
jgi:hypothetical protein